MKLFAVLIRSLSTPDVTHFVYKHEVLISIVITNNKKKHTWDSRRVVSRAPQPSSSFPAAPDVSICRHNTFKIFVSIV